MALPLLLLTTGTLAGALGRLLLARLRRGATVPPGWCELATGLLWAILAAANLPPRWLPLMLTFTWFAVLLITTDLKHNRLPNALTIPAYPAVAALLAIACLTTGGPGPEPLLRATAGALILRCLYATVHTLKPAALGGGDVKLAGPLGAILAAVSWLTLTVALTLAALITLTLHAISPTRWQEGTPHAPGLLASTWLLTFLPVTHL
ncbi:prepilin peptidase [Kibdelosporangium lantanae]|uniref:Prepilin peptidase n=1 Tax=Kibdelosporangium lantanae TaxID=1497396 RepID=A0ABW3M2H4_9PSEU